MAGGDTLSQSAIELQPHSGSFLAIITLPGPAELGAKSIFALQCRASTGMNVPARVLGAQIA